MPPHEQLADLQAPLGRVAVFSPGIRRIPHLRAFLGAERIVFPPLGSGGVDAVVGWGRKPNTARARAYAHRIGRPFVALEDGFVRSVGLGRAGESPLSMVVDDVGIYYDATRPSRLEQLLNAPPDDDPLDEEGLRARARQCAALLRRRRVSKYNDAPDVDLGPKEGERVLVVDQTEGDMSVRLGLAHDGGFRAMLEAGLDEHPDAEVLVKTHPDVAAGKARGHLAATFRDPRVRVLAQPAHPPSLLEQVDAVYTLTSLMGFEALLLGKPVTCFGVPFYAGWGVTDDRVDMPRRTRRRTVEEIFAAAYLTYTRYVDPDTGERCGLERIVEHLALQREMAEANAGTSVCLGFSAWKRGFLPAFLRSPRGTVRFERSVASARRRGVPADARLVVWASHEDAEARRLAEERGVPLWRVEDGFLRSVGLGSDLAVPASLVVDREGIYYDPTRPSELERILQEGHFGPEELRRAAALRSTIVEQGISKYNVGGRGPVGPGEGDGRPVVLVVGQVEDDASIERGCPGIRRNEELLRAAREAHPDAYLVYKPHPDVLAGNRRGAVSRHRALQLADEVVEDAPLGACLAIASEVHTMTSLVGFEALLRELPVVVHGQPFYAGWGLTRDVHPHPRRTRRLTLDELVAGTLIRYPRYVSRRTGRFTTPEAIVRQLGEARARNAGAGRLAMGRVPRLWVKANNLLRGVLRAS
ncbi:MAG: capsular polysaccharide biosynthesis protein [Myxococcota bacterium]